VPGLRLFEVRVSVALRRLLLGLAAILVGAYQAAGQAGCPAAIATELAAEAPVCELLSEGRLHSAQGNGAVDYRLYRWTPLDWPEPPLHDSPPYNINAVTLSLAAPGAAPFWTAHYWPDSAWIEQPYLAQHPEYGEFLVVPGRFFGTSRGLPRILSSCRIGPAAGLRSRAPASTARAARTGGRAWRATCRQGMGSGRA